MFSHRSFLALGATDYESMIKLIDDAYELVNLKLTFEQGFDPSGKVQTRVFSGVMHLTLPILPPTAIIEWSLNPRMYKDGVIVLVDSENIPIQKIEFENAACTAFDVDFEATGKAYASTKMTIHAEVITVGNGIRFKNDWEY